jgi:hypothetical protein
MLTMTAFFHGCAKIEVYPASQEQLENKGIPFYLQRPYVVVKKSFPIEGEEGYLFGTVDPATGMVHFADMSNELSKRLGIDNKIPISTIRKESRESGEAGKAHGAADDGPESSATGEAEEEDHMEEKVVTDASGIAKWDSSVPDTIEINEFFKIVYLPDLDEKYVISSSAGMGTAKLSVAMGPGGVMNQFQINLDNSEIGKFVMESAKTAVSLAKKAAEVSIGKPFSAADVAKTRSIVVKYIYVGLATPGIYPILKNSEYSRLSTGHDPYLIRAEWPHTRFSVKVRKKLSLSADPLLDTTEVKPTEDVEVQDGKIKAITEKLEDANDIDIAELGTAAKFDSIPNGQSRIVFTIPKSLFEDKFRKMKEDEQNKIKDFIMDKVYEIVGEEDEEFLTSKKYIIKLFGKRD